LSHNLKEQPHLKVVLLGGEVELIGKGNFNPLFIRPRFMNVLSQGESPQFNLLY
jgi:hypothetical protein